MRQIVQIAALLLALLLCAACQPTPEKDVVINRGEEDLEALIRTTPAPDAVSLSESVSALPVGSRVEEGTIVGRLLLEDVPSAGGAIMRFDADVIVPDLSAWPICAVERSTWSADERIAILKAATNGAPIYAPGVYQHASKAYYEQLLNEMKDGERVAIVDRIYAEDPDLSQTWTEQVQEYYRYAPQNIELNPFDETTAKDDWTAAFYRIAEPDVYMDFYADGTKVTFGVFDRNIQDENYVRQGEWPGAEPGRELVHPSLTLEEAEQKAQMFLSQIGFGDATLSPAETRKAQRSNFFTFAVESEGYLLVFRKAINGIPGISPSHPEANPSDSYAAAWPQEGAELYVDSEGIWSLVWQDPTHITERLTDSAALLGFDALLAAVKARMLAENADAASRMIERVCVTQMQLGYCIVPKQDAPDAGYTLPVWIVDYEVQFNDGRTVPYSFTLNALNGANLHLDFGSFGR